MVPGQGRGELCAERLAWLAQVVPGLEGSGVIYVLTIADTTRVASFLRTRGIDAHAYRGETEPERRLELEDALIANEVKALVATSALGMGFGVRSDPQTARYSTING
jgi:ATP-dependent DNA helicase RecQ